jgi:hypothetical protein
MWQSWVYRPYPRCRWSVIQNVKMRSRAFRPEKINSCNPCDSDQPLGQFSYYMYIRVNTNARRTRSNFSSNFLNMLNQGMSAWHRGPRIQLYSENLMKYLIVYGGHTSSQYTIGPIPRAQLVFSTYPGQQSGRHRTIFLMTFHPRMQHKNWNERKIRFG